MPLAKPPRSTPTTFSGWLLAILKETKQQLASGNDVTVGNVTIKATPTMVELAQLNLTS